MENMSKNIIKRKSSIDLLKIFAMLLICLSHASQTFRDINELSGLNITNIVSSSIYTLGNIGVTLFVICSCYFLAEKDRPNYQRLLNILLDSMLISIIILLIFVASGFKFDSETIISLIFPDVFALNWFVPCYVIFCVISPLIVIGLKQASKKAHLALMVLLLLFYGFLSILGFPPIGSRLFQFIYLLIIVSYYKWHPYHLFNSKKKCFLVSIVLFSINYLLHFVFYFIKTKFGIFEFLDFFSFFNPIIVFSLLGLFFLFERMQFENKFVTYMATGTLFVYVIHENYLLRTITRVNFYNYFETNYSQLSPLIAMFVCGIACFILGFILAIVYKETLGKLTQKISDVIYKYVIKFYSNLTKE